MNRKQIAILVALMVVVMALVGLEFYAMIHMLTKYW